MPPKILILNTLTPASSISCDYLIHANNRIKYGILFYLKVLRVVLRTTRHIPTLNRCLSQATHQHDFKTSDQTKPNKTCNFFTNPFLTPK
ncbi:hypothetical protein HanIR_Chr12g0581821 [Helianthus annuus]|nr:hypothetical protein HanIR_Chr12g0581821 [Helianthus annuus]